ncbi:MAG: YraN family protein [Rhodocyclaceae bacterium]
MLPVKPNDTTDGARAEALAATWLEQQGLTVVERNFRVRGGEIDLICRDGKTMVFVEVRLRRRSDFGGAGASITTSKRRRLVLAARHYLVRQPDALCRFDCVLMTALNATGIEWMKNAFSADDV